MKKIFSLIILCFISVIMFSLNNTFFVQANQTEILQISKGGTNANTAAGALTNIFGTNFANYSGVLPVNKGGTTANNYENAQDNLGLSRFYPYSSWDGNQAYVKVATLRIYDEEKDAPADDTNQIINITGMNSWGSRSYEVIMYITATQDISKSVKYVSAANYLAAEAGYVERQETDLVSGQIINVRDYYLRGQSFMHQIEMGFMQSSIKNIPFTRYQNNAMPTGYTTFTPTRITITVTTPEKYS
ncbi:MAG: hypothetical protein LBT85_02025 [Bifidobacteriaceae bacterium]|nr:hypothetical protein [Bifidobacteriaceae bacterium]